MREIKFRAWDILDAKMLNNDNINFYELSPTEKNEYFIFMEYTGLKDKNGKEIYEGDIILLGENLTTNKNMYGEVVFQDGRYQIKDDEGLNDFFDDGDIERVWFEVIGNIYENKELLDETIS